MRREVYEHESPVLQLLTALLVGMLGVVVSLWAFSSLIGPQATHEAALFRMASFIYWTQPFVYLGAGLIAGRGDPKAGHMRAPVIGLFLASFAYMAIRRIDLLPAGGSIPGYMITAGALFGLMGAGLAHLLRERTSMVVTLIAIGGLIAYFVAYMNLGSVAGTVQHEVVQRAQGMTVSMTTEPVSEVPLSLLDPETRTVLYRTTSNNSGHYLFSKLPLGAYVIHTIYGQGQNRAIIQQRVEVKRTIMGGALPQLIVLPTEIREAGRIFE